jgi:hypothetical protein
VCTLVLLTTTGLNMYIRIVHKVAFLEPAMLAVLAVAAAAMMIVVKLT